MDYYEILGVSLEASQEEIRHAFRERARACHPDRVADLDPDLRQLAEEKMVRLNEAYAVLRHPARRAAYDQKLRQKRGGPPPPPPAPREETDAPPRSRIGEQAFIPQAAAEELVAKLKHVVGGGTEWLPVAFPGATLALKASRGRRDDYFILLAKPRLDDDELRRFLRRLKSWAGRVDTVWWRRERVLGFAAAVEFSDADLLRRRVERFNSALDDRGQMGPVTLVDLVHWTAVPGAARLDLRLKTLLK